MKSQPELFRALSSNASELAEQEQVQSAMVRWLKIIALSSAIISIIALGVVLSVTRSIVMPIVAGIVVGLIIGPLGDRAKTRSVPSGLTYTVLILALFGGFIATASAILPAADTVAQAIPLIKDRLALVAARLQIWIGGPNLVSGGNDTLDQTTMLDWASKALSFLTPALSQALIFLFTLILFLAGRNDIRRNLTLAFTSREKRLALLKTVSNVENRLTDYFVTVGAINAAFSLSLWLIFSLVGLPSPERWAALVFLLNFLPVVGPLIVKSALLAYALFFAPTLLGGLIPLAAFVCCSLLEANVITPNIVGSRMTMNPLLVFVSVIFWTWLWGFPGAFLAMPFLAIASAIQTEHSVRKAPVLPG